MPKTCHFYKELHAILSDDPTSTTKSPMDTSGELKAMASRVNLKDKVVDNEVELEEDVGQVTGSAGDMASQDLILTLEWSSQSQQSISGIPEAGEGSSIKYSLCFDTAWLHEVEETLPCQSAITSGVTKAAHGRAAYGPDLKPHTCRRCILGSSVTLSSVISDMLLGASSYILVKCLRQIRGRMRRSKEDMFRELLQSSDQAKSDHRAWRETINEKLEMDSQERRQAQEQVIKLMQDQTEMLWSLIVLQVECMCAQLLLQPIQNCLPCPSSPHVPSPSQYSLHSIPRDIFHNDNWTDMQL
ncbi:uncharacterized protein LOC141981882 [Natator depressus]|uniref:uncharacterized protein LOC141981882 n=1 Tax=Natator depressus TaxID=27790 RepID=UPI003EB6CBA4